MINTETKFNVDGVNKMKQNENVGLSLTNIWTVTCLDADGNEKWAETKKILL